MNPQIRELLTIAAMFFFAGIFIEQLPGAVRVLSGSVSVALGITLLLEARR